MSQDLLPEVDPVKLEEIMTMEYVLVSQGIEIFRTTDKSEAEGIMNPSNNEWEKYVQKCRDNGEPFADNEIFLYEEDILDKYKKRFEIGEKAADIMTDMEREFRIPLLNDVEYNNNNPEIMELYRKISDSREWN